VFMMENRTSGSVLPSASSMGSLCSFSIAGRVSVGSNFDVCKLFSHQMLVPGCTMKLTRPDLLAPTRASAVFMDYMDLRLLVSSSRRETVVSCFVGILN